MMRLHLLLLGSLLSGMLSAQNGTILVTTIDEPTGEPLIGATVRTKGGGGISDLNGQVRLSMPAGTYVLNISLSGYQTADETVTVQAGETREVSVRLREGTNLLQEATVTSGKFEKPLGKVTVSLDLIKPRLLESVNATSVDQVLVKVPGVSIVDGQASIRGGAGFSYGAGTRVLLLMDDIPALQADAGYPNWIDLPVENVGQTEVLKGAASALYGSSAMNGIINLRTNFARNKPETDISVFTKIWGSPRDPQKQWWGRDTAEWEVPFESAVSAAHRRQAGKWDIVVGTYALYRNSFMRNTYSRYGRITPNIRYRVNDRLTIGVNSNFNFGKSGSYFLWANDTWGAYQAGLNSTSQSLGRLRFTVDPTLQYFDRAGNKHKLLNRLYYIENNNSGGQSNGSRMYYNEYQFQRPFKNGLVLTAGAVSIHTTVKESDLYGKGNYTNQNTAAYLQLDQEWFERLNVSAGVRYESNTLHSPTLVYNDILRRNDTIPGGVSREAKPVFRFGVNYQLGQATYVRASWGQGYRYPTIAEKFIRTGFGGGNVVPNSRLVSETGWTAELGLKQGIKMGSWLGYADVTGFISEYDNMMEFVLAALRLVINPGPPPRPEAVALFQSQNTGNTRVWGYETSFMGEGRLGEGQLFLMAGYTWFKPTYREFTKAIDESSSADYNVLKYRYRHQVKWDSEYKYQRLSAGLSVLYNSHMEAIDALFQSPVNEPFRAVKTFRDKHNKGFTLLDVRAAYNVTAQLKLNFIVSNLLNTEYTQRPAQLEAPRNYTLRLDYKIR